MGNDVDRQIILKLSKLPRYASDIAIDLGISKPAVKKHLEKLKDAGFILKHESEDSDDKKQYYCINSDLSFSFSLDLNPNYFSYRTKNTNITIRQSIFEKSSESSSKYTLQASVLGDKSGVTSESVYLRGRGKLKAANAALTQLGRAFRDIELNIRAVEENRHLLLGDKNEIITRIKAVINSLVSEPMEREIIFSFFYRTIESFDKGISIKKFLEDIFLKAPSSRAGVSGDTTPQSVEKQRKRIKRMEILLNNIINEFVFIKKIRDANNEQIIVFDF